MLNEAVCTLKQITHDYKMKKNEKKPPRDRIFTQPSKYFSILQDIAIGSYFTLFTYTPPLRAPTL